LEGNRIERTTYVLLNSAKNTNLLTLNIPKSLVSVNSHIKNKNDAP